jgi:hypothetical protein
MATVSHTLRHIMICRGNGMQASCFVSIVATQANATDFLQRNNYNSNLYTTVF